MISCFAEIETFRFWPKTMDYNKAFGSNLCHSGCNCTTYRYDHCFIVLSLFWFPELGGAPVLTPMGGGGSGLGASSGGGVVGESAPIRAPASLWRCSRIMHLLRDLHPTLLSALEGIVDQVGARVESNCKVVL